MPASRSARATTFAPRSWPSRPGFAITTLIGVSCIRLLSSENARRRVLAPYLTQHVADLPHARPRANSLLDERHEVRVERRGVALDLPQGVGHAPPVARALHVGEPRHLAIA